MYETSTKSVIMKYPPFDVNYIGEKHPLISHLLAIATAQLTELPDFSEDKKVAVFSDFGGEHKGAGFNTYSFLIIAYDKITPFIEATEQLRRKHGILEPFSEFSYKDLNYGPRQRALNEFLHITETLLHGALITLVVDKKIETLFGTDRKSISESVKQEFSRLDLGNWKFETAEKALRICHAIAFFASLTTHSNQRLLWYCDNDPVNENTNFFNDTKKILNYTAGFYLKHSFEILGFAKSFEGKSHLDDLLSISDFAAGVIQDLMTGHYSKDGQITEKKVPLVKWLTQRSKFLTKITIEMRKLPNGDIGSGVVQFETPKSTDGPNAR
ncbi:hypothetical protein [Pseudomonas putida]|uniref:hypothetical protein n=1 Tax=Pseudomonas putida TaxID=303 RepID=UPI00162AE156|nr:hypothetical protein [Pseudomonas putida]QNG10634.1 hypothetical protein GPM17_20350 [Pseudomonas putida]HDS1059330.1 hypothetical protein [Pseudomonas putida]